MNEETIDPRVVAAVRWFYRIPNIWSFAGQDAWQRSSATARELRSYYPSRW